MPTFQTIDATDTLPAGRAKINANAALLAAAQLTATVDLWANRPSAATAGDGAIFFATDIGNGDAFFVSNGTLWLPANGSQIFAVSGVNATHSGGTSEIALATFSIPAGLLTLNAALKLKFRASITTSASITRDLRVRLGGVAGTLLYVDSFNTASTITGLQADIKITNRDSLTVQYANARSFYSNNTSGVQNNTAAVDTSAAVDLVITGQLTGGSTSGLIVINSYELELIAAS